MEEQKKLTEDVLDRVSGGYLPSDNEIWPGGGTTRVTFNCLKCAENYAQGIRNFTCPSCGAVYADGEKVN